MARNREIDCSNGQVTALEAPDGPQRAKIPEPDLTRPLPERGVVTKIVILLQRLQQVGATAFDNI